MQCPPLRVISLSYCDLTVTSLPVDQIQQWEQNLEQLHLQLFQLRCYQSSLQGGELPNPKSLLAAASRPSKSMLGRLGVFSVSSFHALVRPSYSSSSTSPSLSSYLSISSSSLCSPPLYSFALILLSTQSFSPPSLSYSFPPLTVLSSSF